MLTPSSLRRAARLAFALACLLSLARPASASLPGPPGNPFPTSISTGSVAWTWADSTGATSYQVVLATKQAEVLATPATNHFTHPGLEPNVTSAIIVIGSNSFGGGQQSNFGQINSYAKPPSALTVVGVSSTGVNVAWSLNGSRSPTVVEVQRSTDNAAFVGYSTYSVTSASITGLSPFTTYYFQARAYNDDGATTTFSASVSTRTDLVVPLIPGTPFGAATSTSDITWTWAGAQYAAGYQVYLATKPSELIASPSTNSFILHGLSPNGLSAIVVIGGNSVGVGPASASGAIHTLANPPAALQIDHITSIYAALSWSLNGNSTSTVFDLQRSNDGSTFFTHSTFSVTKTTVPGLSPSTSYYFKVRGFNDDGIATAFTGAISTLTDVTGGVPPAGAAGTPSVTARSTDDVTWAWSAASDATGYRVYLASNTGALVASPAVASVTVTGLGPNALTAIVVRGTNPTGDGPLSPSATAYSLAKPPTTLAVTSASTDTVSLSWNANGNPGGTTFALETSTDNAGFAQYSTYTVAAATATPIAPATTFYFRVRALNNDAVATAYSITVSTRTGGSVPGDPGAPAPVVQSTAEVSWSWSGAALATSYKVYLATKPAELIASPSTNSFIMPGLGPNGLAAIVVRGVNNIGAGPFSPPGQTHTFARPPASPTVFNVSSIYAALSWSANGNPAGTTYVVDRSSDNAAFTTYSTYSVTQATVASLAPSTSYYFRALATNDEGVASAFSATVSTLTAASGGIPPPGQVGSLAAAVLSTSDVKWSWTPASDATGYRVYRASKPAELLAAPAVSSVTLSGLSPNAASGIVVRGVNDTDLGPLSAPATAYSFAMPPTALSTVTVSTDSVGLSWGANGNPGGTRYELQASTDGAVFPPASTYTVTAATVIGLSPSTSYYYRVRATNVDAAATAFTAVLNVKTASLAPGPPGTPVPAALSTGDVQWSWSAAVDAVSYEMFLATKTAELIAAPPSSPFLLRGFSPNAASSVVVRGVNGTGSGPLSPAASTHTFAAAVSTLAVTHITSIYAALSWSADGNPAGTRYGLQKSTDGSLFTAYSTYTVRAATVTQLSPSTSYYFRVRAVNDEGVPAAFTAALSTLTDATGGIPPPGPPGTPVPTVLGPSDISWSWGAASNADSYRVYLDTKPAEQIGATAGNSITIPLLGPNSANGVIVQATNATGDGPPSAPASTHTFAAVPSGLAVVSASSLTVNLSWGANANPAGTTFEVQKASQGAAFAAHSTYTTTSALVAALLPLTTYTFKVRAVSLDNIPTAFDVPVTTATRPPNPGLPGTPLGVVGSTGDVSWSWAGASDAAGYDVFLASKQAERLLSPATNSFTLTGLDPNALSGIVVRGVNSSGFGPLSASATKYTLASAPAALALGAVSSGTIALSWNAGGNTAGTIFELQSSSDAVTFTAFSTTTAAAMTPAALLASSTYAFRVRAANGDAVATGFSNTVSTRTGPPLPGTPGTPTPSALSTGSLTWSWTASTYSVSYQVYLATKASELLASPATDHFSLAGLGTNTPSAIIVRGVNANGTGPLSAAATVYTLAAAPSALAFVSVSSDAVSLSWNDGGNPFGTVFSLRKATDGVTFALHSTYTVAAVTLPGLTPSSTYAFKVAAANGDAVPTAFSNSVSTITPPPLPGPSGTPVAAVTSTGDISWSWSASANAASYQVFLASKTTELLIAPATNSFSLAGLGPNTPSGIVVRGVNITGIGALSASATAYSLAMAPSALAFVSVSSDAVSLSWNDGGNPGGTVFTLQKSSNGGTFSTHSTYTAAAAFVSGLLASTTYDFKVFAVNGASTATAFSNAVSTKTPPPLPGAAGTPVAAVTSTADISWSWTASPYATSYQVFLASKTSELLVAPATNSFSLAGLGPNTPSGIVVRGVNVTGNGPLSASATAYSLAMPPTTLVTVAVTATSVDLTWAANGNPAQTSYEISKASSGGVFSPLANTTALSATLSSLSSSTAYDFRVRASNGGAVLTAFSNTASTATNGVGGSPLPGTPGTPSAAFITTGSLTWSWAAASNASSYKLFLASSPTTLLSTSAGNVAALSGFGPNSPSGIVVAATNGVGDGPLSPSATAYTSAMGPTGLALLAVDTTSVSLSWGANGNPGGTVYEVQKSTNGSLFSAHSTYTAAAVLVTGLSTSTAYDFRVRALNGDSVGSNPSNTVSTVTPTSLPGPTGTPAVAFLSTGSVVWGWTAASKAAGYKVFPASAAAVLLASPAGSSVTFLGVPPNTPSGIVVRGTNADGDGPLSPSATVYTYASPPSALTVVSASSFSVSLSWNANGDPAGTVFELQKATDGVSFASLSTTTAAGALVLGLSTSAAYDFRVRAANADLVNTAFSNTASTQTLPPLPGAAGTPAPVVLSTGDVSWSWTASSYAAGYQVFLASKTGELLAVPSTNSFILSGLGPNATSAIVVRGVNATGNGPLSAAATAYSLAAVPSSLAFVSVSSDSLSLSWSANGNPAGTFFTLSKASDGATFNAYSTYTAAAALVTGLLPSTTYDFKVSALNSGATVTAFSNTASTKTLPVLPGAAGTPAAVVLSTGGVSWSWTASSYAAGYQVFLASKTGELLAAPATNSFSLSGLAPNSTSAIVVRGVNATGNGPLSASATAFTFAMAPAALAFVTVSSDSLSLSWSANGNPAGTFFTLSKASDGATFNAYSTYTAAAALVTGLLPSATYDFKVSALNSGATVTAFSNTVTTQTLPALPGAAGTPTAVVPSTGGISWSWTAASSAAGYQVFPASKTGELLAAVSTNSFSLSGLGPNTPSGIVVRGVNATGGGPLSGSATAYTLAMPPASLVTAAVTATSVDLAWAANGNPAQTGYEVQRATDGGVSFFPAANTTALSATLSALSSSTAYAFRVRAQNGGAVPTAFSNTSSTATNGVGATPLPGASGTPTATGLSTGDVAWAWTAAPNATSYKVFLASSATTLLAAPAGNAVTLLGYGPNSPSGIVVCGVNGVGLGPLSASATVFTYATAPASLAFVFVDTTSVSLSWNANGNSAGTVFELQKSTNGVLFAPLSTTTASGAFVSGLSTSTAYDFRVRAANGDAVNTAFSNTASTVTPTSLPGAAGTPSPSFVSTGSIAWGWAASSRAAAYQVFLASKTSELLAAPATNSLTLPGLDPNTPSGIVVRGTNPDGNGPLSAAATVYTYAAAPTGLFVVSAASFSLTLSWGANGNTFGTVFQVQSSSDGVSFAAFSTATAAPFVAPGLAAAATYFFRLRAVNGDAVPTAYTGPVSGQTAPPPPGAPGAPTAAVLSTADVTWSWPGAASATSYQAYLASKTAEVLASPATNSFTLSGLGVNGLSGIVVRGFNSTGPGPLSASATAYTLAMPPAALAFVSVSSTSASLAWDANGNPAATTFALQLSSDGVSFNPYSTYTVANASVTGLSPSTTAAFRVRALNGDGAATAFSNSVSTLTTPPLPGTPGTPGAVVLSTADVAWTWAGAPFAAGYQVFLASKTAELLAAPATNSFTLYGLGPNGLSGIVVRGVNVSGAGPLSASATAYTFAMAPAALAFVSVSSSSLSLSWSANGNPAGTSYSLQKSSDGVTFNAYSTYTVASASVTGLSASATAAFRVSALNGASVATAFSNIASTQTLPPVPPAPGVPSAVVTSTADVTWSWAGSTAAAGYQVYLASKTAELLAAPATNSFTLSGLGPNGLSGIVVRAVNVTGAGPLSLPATAFTFALPPAALAVVSAATTSVSLSWSANGDPAGTVFELQSSTDGVLFASYSTTTAAAAAVTGLLPSATFTFRVRAFNADAVATAFSGTASTVTAPAQPGVPGVPTPVVLSSAAVSWSWAPASGAAGYRVYPASDTATLLASPAAPAVVLTGYSADSLSAIVVRAFNGGGQGSLSPSGSAFTLALPPSALGIAGFTPTSVDLSWSANGNPAGIRYEVQESTDGAAFAPYSTFTVTVVSVPSLRPNTTYTFRVRAFNDDAVPTAFSGTVSTATPPTLPSAPGLPAAVVLSTGDVSWSWGGSTTATSFRVFPASATASLLASPATNSVLLPGYGPNALSGIVVRGVNSNGTGPLSPAATAYTFAMPPAALTLGAVSSAAVSLAWSANGDPAGTVFELQSSTDGVLFAAYSTYTLAAAAVPGLSASTTYVFKVRARNGDGVVTAFAGPVSTQTLPPPPGSPGTPAALVLSTGDVVWSWASASSAAGYQVYRASDAVLLGSPAAATLALSGLGANTLSGLVVRGVNPSGPGPLSSSATAYTFAMPPASLSLVSVSSSSISLSWSANGNPAGTVFTVKKATDGVTFVSDSTTTAAAAAVSGLTPSTAYGFKVVAANGDAVPTAFSNAVSTATLPPAPGAPGRPSGTVLGVSSVSWVWGAALDAASYLVATASNPASLSAAAAAAAYVQTGLAPNTTASIVVAGLNASGQGVQSSSAAPVFTMANPPTGAAAGAVYATSAAISWGLNGNPPGTAAELQKSTDNGVFSLVSIASGVSWTATSLRVCTSYWFRVRDVNGDGLPTAFAAAVNLLTLPSTPTAPGSLSAAPLAGNRIALSWDPSPDESVTEYRLYWDAGTGTVSTAAPLAVYPSSVTSATTGVLASSAAYRFALRAKNRCGLEEANAGVLASAPSLASLTGVRAAVTAPLGGRKVKGNMLTVAADISLGSVGQTASVLFQYRPSSAAAWRNIPAADSANPNPDLTAPYFIHWNADALGVAAEQAFDLRALATDIQGSTDAAPSAVSVAVVPAAALTFDVSEGLVGGKVVVAQPVFNTVANTIQTGAAVITRLQIPAGALADDVVTVTNDPAVFPPAPTDAQAVGVVSQVEIQSADKTLANGQSAALTLGFADADGDGVVDGTTLRADRLVMYSAATAAGPWVRDLASSVDPVKHTVTGNTRHFSFFALFAPAAQDLNSVRVYPVPFMPNGGNADQGVPYTPGNPNSGIVFDNLPSVVTIRVYTVSGQRVTEFTLQASGGKIQWDVKNDRGHDVASGGYVAVITGPGSSPVIKRILIVR